MSNGAVAGLGAVFLAVVSVRIRAAGCRSQIEEVGDRDDLFTI